MSDDVFREVDEEVRREQLQKLWERYQGYVVAAVFLIVVGVGGWRIYEWHQGRQSALFGSRFETAVNLAEGGKHEEAERIFAQIVAQGPAGYRTIARIRQAAEVAQRDPAAALEIYRQVAGDGAAEQVLRDLASLRAAALLIDAGAHTDARKLLEPMAQGDYRHTARELLALNAWKANDRPGALKWYAAILTDTATPASVRTRVETLIALGAADGTS